MQLVVHEDLVVEDGGDDDDGLVPAARVRPAVALPLAHLRHSVRKSKCHAHSPMHPSELPDAPETHLERALGPAGSTALQGCMAMHPQSPTPQGLRLDFFGFSRV